MRFRSLVALVSAAAATLAAFLIWLGISPAINDPSFARADRDVMAGLVVAGGLAVVVAAAMGWLAGGRLARPLAELRRLLAVFPAEPDQIGGVAGAADVRMLARALERTARDVGARLAETSRERDELALLSGAAGEGLMQVDADGRLIRFNTAAARLLGLPAEARGQHHASVVRDARLRGLIGRGLAGEEVATAEVDAGERRILASIEPLDRGISSAGGTGGVVAVLVDLTQLRRLEAVRRDFVANVSHELKTPLTSIRGYAETLLSDDLPDEVRRRFVGTIGENARRLQRIVDDLLDLSAVESGGWHPDSRTVDLEDAAMEVWRELETRADRQQVALGVDVASDARLARADPLALRQIFTNLFDNALRHSPAGGHVRVRVTSSAASSPCGELGEVARVARSRARVPSPPSGDIEADVRTWRVVEVSDTGAGIPHAALPRVFERFYRVDPARSRAEGGTGLGLAVVKHLVESHGGCVAADSDLGRGTTIRFVLPGA